MPESRVYLSLVDVCEAVHITKPSYFAFSNFQGN